MGLGLGCWVLGVGLGCWVLGMLGCWVLGVGVEGGARRVPERHRRQDDLGSIEGEPRVHRGRVEHQCEVRPLAALLAAADVHGHLGLGSGAGWRTATT